MREINRINPDLVAEFKLQADHPPGNDPVLGAFYKALAEMSLSNSAVTSIINTVSMERNITSKHLANLAFRSFQAIHFKLGELSYRENVDYQSWVRDLELLGEKPSQLKDFESLLRTKSTSSTIYQRYVGPYALINRFFGKNPVTVADLGCGGNYGLRGFSVGETFKPFVDNTPGQTVKSLVLPAGSITLERGLAVDQEDPDDPKIRNWRHACSFYPKEIGLLQNLVDFEERIQKSTDVDFMHADLLSSDPLPENWADAVILSTMLYQLSTDQQHKLLNKSKQVLRDKGILIVQDFAKINEANPMILDFDQSWGDKDSYRTFITSKSPEQRFFEAFIFDGGRCTSVKPGKDFARIFTGSQPNDSSAAFAHSTSWLTS